MKGRKVLSCRLMAVLCVSYLQSMAAAETYLLTELIKIGEDSELMSRFITVERSSEAFKITSSEFGYLGDQVIPGKIETEDGESVLTFITEEDVGKRTFTAEVIDDDWDYIQGEVFAEDEEDSVFVLRKIPEPVKD